MLGHRSAIIATQETRAQGSQVQGQSLLQTEFKDSLENLERHNVIKINRQNRAGYVICLDVENSLDMHKAIPWFKSSNSLLKGQTDFHKRKRYIERYV